MDIFKENFHNLQNFSKNVINDLYEHYTTGASPGFERGVARIFFWIWEFACRVRHAHC